MTQRATGSLSGRNRVALLSFLLLLQSSPERTAAPAAAGLPRSSDTPTSQSTPSVSADWPDAEPSASLSRSALLRGVVAAAGIEAADVLRPRHVQAQQLSLPKNNTLLEAMRTIALPQDQEKNTVPSAFAVYLTGYLIRYCL